MDRIYITAGDNSLLRRLLALSPFTRSSFKARSALERELDRAWIVDSQHSIPSFIALGSTFECEDLDTGMRSVFTLSHPEEHRPAADRVDLLSPMGTAVLGCCVGDVASWTTPAGTTRLRILRVYHPRRVSTRAGLRPALEPVA